jgi:hypothetical protein
MSKYFELPVILTFIFYWLSSIVWLKTFFSLPTTLGNQKSKVTAGILKVYRKVES